MNRTIKFRAWDKDKKIMRGWLYFANYPSLFFNMFFEKQYPHLYAYCEAHNLIPLQYIGLEDKNGKEIYEGDILEVRNTHFLVEWDEKKVAYVGEGQSYYKYRTGTTRTIAKFRIKKIVGNIFENPELLEKILFDK